MSEDGEPLAADAEPTTEAPEDGSLDADAELLLAASEEDAPEAEDEDELDEVELDGKKVRVSKGFKDHLLRESDYRRKTHQASEEKRALQAKEKEIEERAALWSVVQGELADARALDSQIEQYKAITQQQWRQLREEDRDRYDDARADHSLLMDKRRELEGQINNKIGAFQAKEKEEQSKWVAKQEAEIKVAVADWSPTKEKEVKTHIGEKFGFSAEELDPIKDAKLVKVMAYIHKMDTAIQRAKGRASKARGESGEPIAPVRKVVGTGKPSNSPSQRLLKNDPEAFDRAFLKSLG